MNFRILFLFIALSLSLIGGCKKQKTVVQVPDTIIRDTSSLIHPPQHSIADTISGTYLVSGYHYYNLSGQLTIDTLIGDTALISKTNNTTLAINILTAIVQLTLNPFPSNDSIWIGNGNWTSRASFNVVRVDSIRLQLDMEYGQGEQYTFNGFKIH